MFFYFIDMIAVDTKVDDIDLFRWSCGGMIAPIKRVKSPA